MSIQTTDYVEYGFSIVETQDVLNAEFSCVETGDAQEFIFSGIETADVLDITFFGAETTDVLEASLGCSEDIEPPLVLNEIPLRGSINNSPTTNIALSIRDLGDCPTGVNIKTVKIYVNDLLAFDGTVSDVTEGTVSSWVKGIQSGFDGPAKDAYADGNGIRVVLDPLGPFPPASIVTVRVIASDKG